MASSLFGSLFGSPSGDEDAERAGETSDRADAGGESAAPAHTSTAKGNDVFGSLLSSVSNIGRTIKTGINKVADTALSDFNREQAAFVRGKGAAGREAAVPPWVGCDNEETMREHILALSSDKRNFLRDPPPGARDFEFDFDVYFPIAMATLQEDKRLEEMRFELVPKQVTEQRFWRNFFYRVSLIKQSSELTAMAASRSKTTSPKAGTDLADSTHSATDAPAAAAGSAAPAAAPAAATTSSSSAATTTDSKRTDPRSSLPSVNNDADEDLNADAVSEASFAGDELAEAEAEVGADLAELESDLARATAPAAETAEAGASGAAPATSSSASSDIEVINREDATDDWEKELQMELEDFELGDDDDSNDLDLDNNDEAWEAEINQMLAKE